MDFLSFSTVPANSVSILPEEARYRYLQKTIQLPEKVREIMFSDETGAYVRGLGSSYDINVDLVPKIALTILKIAIGEHTPSELTKIISQELELSLESAQKMALEIEHDIFQVVRPELGRALRQHAVSGDFQKNKLPKTTSSPSIVPPNVKNYSSRPQNMLNLKELAGKPSQPQLPPKPFNLSIPSPNPLKPPSSSRPTMPPKHPASPITPLRFT